MVQYIYTLGADLISQERGGRTYTYLYDGHGSVVGLMSESGSVTDTYTYDAFGNLLKSTVRTQNNYRYCGEQFDSTTGLYYLRARYMDTSTGRFISQDSYAGSAYDPVSLHKYLYCNSDPVNNVDPSGYLAVEGNLALALAGDEYAINRLAIQMTTSEIGYYSRDPRSMGQHISDVLVIGLSIIAALTAVVININMMFEQMDTVITDCASGNTTSAETNTEYRDSKCNNDPVRRNYLDTDANSDDILVSSSGTQYRQNDVVSWLEDNQVPSDAQTILKNPKFKKRR